MNCSSEEPIVEFWSADVEAPDWKLPSRETNNWLLSPVTVGLSSIILGQFADHLKNYFCRPMKFG